MTHIPQTLRCQRGDHYWSNWGHFVPVRPKLPPVTWRPVIPEAEIEPVEAYRWRFCNCGAAERETYATHERKIFNDPRNRSN